jgi:hypothetical protein
MPYARNADGVIWSAIKTRIFFPVLGFMNSCLQCVKWS